MIFQEPMASLNPCFTVGFQIEEVLRFHLGLDEAARRARAIELFKAVGIRRSGGAAEILPAPDVGRPVPARHDRHGDRLRSEAADRRRADHRARRDDPEADPRPAGRPAGQIRHGPDHDHPQYGRGRRDRRPRHRPVQGPQDGRGRRAVAVRGAEASLHARCCFRRCPRTRSATGCRP